MNTMRAAWYERQGAADDVLQVGRQPIPQPGPDEVRVAVVVSGIHIGDVGKRRGYWGSTMPFPLVIPHGDGAGVIDAVGPGVDRARVGQRVWVFLAQSYRPGGTAAEFTVVPSAHAILLPDEVGFEEASGVGIPGITGHRAVLASGSVAGKNVLVTGATGAVGRAAVATALHSHATVVASVRRPEDLEQALQLGAHHAVLAGPQMTDDISRLIGPDSIDVAADVAFDSNIDQLVEVLRYGGNVMSYATGDERPQIPFWPLGLKNITVRFLSNDDFPETANQDAATDLTECLLDGSLAYPVRARHQLEDIAAAHDEVEHGGAGGRVILHLQDAQRIETRLQESSAT